MNTRLKLIRENLGLSQLEYSKKINLPQSTYAQFESGARTIKDVYIAVICQTFHVSENWLRNGKGEMFISVDNSILEELEREYGITPCVKDIIETYLSLDDEKKKWLEEIVLNFKGLPYNLMKYHSVPPPNANILGDDNETTATTQTKALTRKEKLLGCVDNRYMV